MRRFWNFRYILILAACLPAACGDLPATNQNANLPINQNTNVQNANIQNANIQNTSVENANLAANSPVPTPSNVVAIVVTPTPDAAPSNTPAPTDSPVQQTFDANNGVAIDKLVVPVVGVKREQLRDTFTDARSEGRVHDAIDIMAAQNTPVVAAADGEIARFFDSVRGGITIYQYSRDKRLIYYYAHLARRADGLQEHAFVRQGTVIGYVGDTGNAGAGNFHLHFAIWTVNDPKHYWDGANLNPYPLLRQ